MASLFETYSFPVTPGYRFRVGSKHCTLGSGDVRALTLLAHILEQRPARHDLTWLLPFRLHLREMERLNCRAARTLAVASTDRVPRRRVNGAASFLQLRWKGRRAVP